MPNRQFVLRIALFGAIVFTLTMAWLPHPPPVPGNPNDKIQHIVAFVTLSVLAALSSPATPLLRIGERLSFMGALIEVVQSIPTLHRDCDVMDWVADTIAIALTLLVVLLYRRACHRRSAITTDAAREEPRS